VEGQRRRRRPQPVLRRRMDEGRDNERRAEGGKEEREVGRREEREGEEGE
jgi:hypothetical protein